MLTPLSDCCWALKVDWMVCVAWALVWQPRTMCPSVHQVDTRFAGYSPLRPARDCGFHLRESPARTLLSPDHHFVPPPIAWAVANKRRIHPDVARAISSEKRVDPSAESAPLLSWLKVIVDGRGGLDGQLPRVHGRGHPATALRLAASESAWCRAGPLQCHGNRVLLVVPSGWVT